MTRAQPTALISLVILCSVGLLVSVAREQLSTGRTSGFTSFNGSLGMPTRSISETDFQGKVATGPSGLVRSEAVFEQSVFDSSGLALEVAIAPLPRPAQVTTSRPAPRPATPAEIVRGARIPAPPSSLQNASELSCIAVAIYHEARDQEELGQRAVASVILQRAAVPHRWGDSACENVVPTQFSFMTSRYDYPSIDNLGSWEQAVRIAAEAIMNGPMPELRGADHYHATAVFPQWAPKMVRIRSIDDHVFYMDPHSSSEL